MEGDHQGKQKIIGGQGKGREGEAIKLELGDMGRSRRNLCGFMTQQGDGIRWEGGVGMGMEIRWNGMEHDWSMCQNGNTLGVF